MINGKPKMPLNLLCSAAVLCGAAVITFAALSAGRNPEPVSAVSAAVETTTAATTTAATTTTTTTTTAPREEVVLEHPYYIEVDKSAQVVSIYTTNEEGKYEKLVRQMICSTGEDPDELPNGVYPLKESRTEWCAMLTHNLRLYAKYTTQISGDYLFHSVPYFTKRDNSSLNEWYFSELGEARSGGCIRLTVEGAKWIYDNCPPGTPVRILESGVYDPELIEALRPGEPVDGWDPTDPDPDNPDYRPLITTPDPQPDKYAPLYDYQWEWAPEQPYAPRTTATASTAAPTTAPTAAPTAAPAPAPEPGE